MPARAIELPKTMPAIVCHAPEDYRLEELPVPGVGPGEVLVRVEFGRHLRQRPQVLPRRAAVLGRRPARGLLPAADHARATSSSARWWRSARGRGRSTGSRSATAPSPSRSCPAGSAAICLTGKYWMCAVHDIYGFRKRTPGAMAGYVRFPAGALNHKVPAVDAGAPCGVHRAARLLDPRGAARQHRVPGHRGDRRRRPARPRHDRRRPDEAAGAADRRRPQRRPPRDGEALRRRPRAQPDQGRRGRGGAEADRRLRLRRLHRGHRPPAGGGRRPAR